MAYSKSDEAEFSQPVRTGLMDRLEYEELLTLAETDPQSWREMMVGLAARSNLLFGHFFFASNNDIPPFMVDVERRIQQAQARYQPVNLALPRGHIKSSSRIICDSIRLICLSTVADLPEYAEPRILLIQASKPVAIKTTLAIKNEIEHNRAIKTVFGEIHHKPIEWGKDTLWLRNEGVSASKEPTFMATGLMAGQTGFHPYHIKVDDVTTYELGRTKGRRQHAVEWYGATVKPTKEPKTQEECAYTPYFDGELTHVFEKDAARLQIKMPALNRMVKSNDFEIIFNERNERIGVQITPDGMDLRALWPCPLGTGNCPNTEEHYSEYGLHRSVEWLIFEQFLSNPFKFSTQYMLLRASEQDTRIKPDMLRFWTRNKANQGVPNKYNDVQEDGIRYIEYPDDLKRITVKAAHTWDTALGKTKAHDRTVGAIGYRTKDNDLVVMFHKGRWDPVRVLELMTVTAGNDPIMRVHKPVVENANFEKVLAAFGESLTQGVRVVERERANSDKDAALCESGLLAHMMSGKVYLEFEDDDAIQELLAFRQDMGHEHDDVVDALRMCYTELFGKEKRFKLGFVK